MQDSENLPKGTCYDLVLDMCYANSGPLNIATGTTERSEELDSGTVA